MDRRTGRQTDGQTDRRTDTGENITSLAEATIYTDAFSST